MKIGQVLQQRRYPHYICVSCCVSVRSFPGTAEVTECTMAVCVVCCIYLHDWHFWTFGHRVITSQNSPFGSPTSGIRNTAYLVQVSPALARPRWRKMIEVDCLSSLSLSRSFEMRGRTLNPTTRHPVWGGVSLMTSSLGPKGVTGRADDGHSSKLVLADEAMLCFALMLSPLPFLFRIRTIRRLVPPLCNAAEFFIFKDF